MPSTNMPSKLHSRAVRGFTLVELMITVAIIGILGAVAIPQYKDYMTRGRIPDATSGLSSRQVLMEQYFQDNRTYVGAPACASDAAASKYFTFSCSASAATTYTLQAVGKSSMTSFTYTVNQANVRTTTVPTGWTASTSCWVTKKDGTC